MRPLWATVGTRPEAIKLAPVVQALRARRVEVVVCSTGQHPELCADALEAMGLAADRVLPPVRGGLPELLGQLVTGIGGALREARPAAVLVHGDTTSALAGALAASLLHVPLGHVEAGLRTRDPRAPFPEETHRRLVDALADRCFAPTPGARENLLREGIDPQRIFVTGNPVVDAVRSIAGRAPPPEPRPDPLVVVTAHRRENLGELDRICDAVGRLAERGARIVWPVHPNPEIQRVVGERLGDRAGVSLVGPLGYARFVGLLRGARLVLTDSGGVQEEAACLGVPTLVLREVTERPEVLSTGVVALVGTNPAEVVARAERWLEAPPRPVEGVSPLGDGRAGEHIANLVAEWLR